MSQWPPISGAAVVARARDYKGTPYHRDGRKIGAGVDCIGLIICAYSDLGAPVDGHTGHTRGDQLTILTDTLSEYCISVPKEMMQPGDILIFRDGPMYHHSGIYTGEGQWIHAHGSRPIYKVVEQPLDESWRTRLHAVMRYKGAC
jgi:cell wall-associated NlpC family hydrolase